MYAVLLVKLGLLGYLLASQEAQGVPEVRVNLQHPWMERQRCD